MNYAQALSGNFGRNQQIEIFWTLMQNAGCMKIVLILGLTDGS